MYEFIELTWDLFERIYTTDYEDAQSDSFKLPFSEINQILKDKLFSRWKESGKVVVHKNKKIGWIFLAQKEDGIFHIGYSLLPEFRGEGRMSEIINEFIEEFKNKYLEDLSSRFSKITIHAKALHDNFASQRTLLKCQFDKVSELKKNVDCEECHYFIFEYELKKCA